MDCLLRLSLGWRDLKLSGVHKFQRGSWLQGLPKDAPVMILLPGLTGGSHDSYVEYAVIAARWASCSLHHLCAIYPSHQHTHSASQLGNGINNLLESLLAMYALSSSPQEWPFIISIHLVQAMLALTS